MAVPKDLRSRWTYVKGTSRRRLPQLVRRLRQVDLFVHDSVHTTRNTCFELGTIWPALPPGGVAVVDDIHRNLGFSRFIESAAPGEWLATRHVPENRLWGTAIKARVGARIAVTCSSPPVAGHRADHAGPQAWADQKTASSVRSPA